MTARPAQTLPTVVPVFAVPGAILLPGTRLPLIVFEPRYLAMVDDCLGQGRLFGLVQPNEGADGAVPGLYPVGTLARVVAFGESGDGRYLITAVGLNRFRLAGEEEGRAGYRRVRADYSPFALDGVEHSVTLPDRERLLALIRAHLTSLGVSADSDSLDVLPDGELADRMAMACPFLPEEKQALLEASSHAERCRLMIGMIQRELLADDAGTPTMH